MGISRGALLALGSFLLAISLSVTGQPVVTDGIMDLRYTGVPVDKTINLNGDWEFFWKRYIDPVEFGNNLTPELYGKVPAYWTEYSDSIEGITGTGYATYRARIILPELFRRELGLKIPVFDSSCRLYINNRKILSAGIAGEASQVSIPEYHPAFYRFKPTSDTVDIVVHVANFHHRRGGFWLPIEFGQADLVNTMIQRRSIFEASTSGMLLAFAGFFIIFGLIFRNDKSMIWFSGISIGILIRSLCTGSFQLLSFADLQWTTTIRLEYIGSYAAFIFTLLYFASTMPNRPAKYFNPVLIVIFSVFIAIVLVTQVSIFSYTIQIFIPLIMIILIYYMVLSIRLFIRERGKEIFTIIGFVGIIIGALNDIALSNSKIVLADRYILPHTVVFFMIMQVIILIYKWVHSFREEQRLLKEIEYVNRNLENIVVERTSELSNQKRNLELQKEETDNKNLELKHNIELKNRIFSIIAHDLKSPVIDISILTDHIKNVTGERDREEATNMLSHLAEKVTSLIDNLLLWGEGQNNKIGYKPEMVNLTDIVLSNFNLSAKTTKRKDIDMTYNHKGKAVAYCDKDLIDIIIRNLVSNSIKFTGKKGRITVSIEDADRNEGTVRITLSDNGTGIQDEVLQKINSKEIVESSPGTDGEKGTGLGLQLCRDLVEINRGTMLIESEVGAGTTITITLPSHGKRTS